MRPFPSLAPPSALTVTGTIGRRASLLTVSYALRGPLAQLLIPAAANPPGRRDGLWESTCFELFVALKHSPRYWEINLSPAGHWNVYRFAGYRRGMEPEQAITLLAPAIVRHDTRVEISLELVLDRILPPDQLLDIGISAVVHHGAGALSYWALSHCAAQPDFHRRDSFVLEL